MSGDKCSCENPADVSDIDPSVGGPPRVAEVEVCDDRVCELAHFLVRGDQVSLVSVEQAERVGEHKLDPARMPSDITFPSSYVLVHDAAGRLLDKCDIYVLKWTRSGPQQESELHRSDLRVARRYFGNEAQIQGGYIDIPRGEWRPKALIRFIRYRRFGFEIPFEHRYETPVELLSTTRPLAWRLPMASSCVIDNRGFVRP